MKFSIVIPNYNGAHLLKKNLPKVIAAVKGQEVIVVDDASTDESVVLLRKEFPQIRLLVNQQNLRFARTCNVGVNAASGEIVVLLNSDVYPEEDFLLPLGPHFRSKHTFAVGCLELVDKASRGKAIGRFEKGLLVHQEAADRKRGVTLWAFGGSAAFSKDKWLKLGGMDHLFRPAYWEDIDLSYRAWKRGWRVFFEPDSRVHHEPESTNVSAFGRKRIMRISGKNQLLFVWKNIHDGRLILAHLFWLPIRVLQAMVRGDSALLFATLHALQQLPEAIEGRRREKKNSRISDGQVFKIFSKT